MPADEYQKDKKRQDRQTGRQTDRQTLESGGPLTKRQLKASVQQEAVRSRVLGAVDLVRLHQNLAVQEDPVARALLGQDRRDKVSVGVGAPCRAPPSRPHTFSDCWTLLRGIQAVPTMVSQIRPLFHTSTMRPRSSRLISLGGRGGGRGGEERGREEEEREGDRSTANGGISVIHQD